MQVAHRQYARRRQESLEDLLCNKNAHKQTVRQKSPSRNGGCKNVYYDYALEINCFQYHILSRHEFIKEFKYVKNNVHQDAQFTNMRAIKIIFKILYIKMLKIY